MQGLGGPDITPRENQGLPPGGPKEGWGTKDWERTACPAKDSLLKSKEMRTRGVVGIFSLVGNHGGGGACRET